MLDSPSLLAGGQGRGQHKAIRRCRNVTCLGHIDRVE